MTTPQDWECPIWFQLKETMESNGRTQTSYYVLAEECVRLCKEKTNER
jgi:hypothetical protein